MGFNIFTFRIDLIKLSKLSKLSLKSFSIHLSVAKGRPVHVGLSLLPPIVCYFLYQFPLAVKHKHILCQEVTNSLFSARGLKSKGLGS